MKKVSIIVPVYNTSTYLSQCVDSLLAQTLEEIEIILIDDGSTDSSFDILLDYKKKYPKKIKVLQQKNAGQGAARNRALKEVNAKYICFVDSDDWIDAETCEIAYNKAIKTNSDLVFWDLEWFYPDGKTQLHSTFSNISGELDAVGYMLSDPSPCNKLIRSSIFFDHNIIFPENCWYEDMAIIPSLIRYIHHMEYIHKGFYKYRQRENSTMLQKKFNPKLYDIIIAMRHLYNEMEETSYREEMEYLYIFQLLYFASFRFMEFKEYKGIRACYEELREKYPCWKNNPYYKQKSFLFRLYCELLSHEAYTLASLLISLRKLIGK